MTPEMTDVSAPAVPSVPEGVSVEGLAVKPDVDVTTSDAALKLPDASVEAPAVEGS